MRHLTVSASAIVCAGLVAGTAAADSLAIRQLQRDEEERFVEDVASLVEPCGKELAAEIDWSSFDAGSYRENYSVGGYCGGAVTAIRGICGDDLGREAIAGQINRLVCAIGEGPSAALSEDGTYRYTFSWDDANAYQWHQKWLGDNL